MGAKFAPCMRLDDNLKRVLEEERRNESETGCCVKSDGSGCIQASQKECSVRFFMSRLLVDCSYLILAIFSISIFSTLHLIFLVREVQRRTVLID